MQDADSNLDQAESRGAVWLWLALLIVAAVVLVMMQRGRREPVGPWVNRELPPLDAAGWLNTDGPLSEDELRGRVVLVDFWASYCGPCLQHMPELADYHERFAARGVSIVGLTNEPPHALERIEQVVEKMEIDWPIAYGAHAAYAALAVYGTPTYVLYDRTGRSIWGGHTLNGLEDATIAALAKK